MSKPTFMYKLFILLIVLCIFSCTPNKKENDKVLIKKSEPEVIVEEFDHDSCLFSPKINLRIDELFISPFDKSKLIIVNYNGPNYQVDINNLKLDNLVDVIGGFGKGVRKTSILQDNYNDSLIWAFGFHEGLIVHNKFTKENKEFSNSEYFDRNALTCFYISKDYVWFGSSKGLYSVGKGDYKIRKLSVFSDIWIKKILPKGSDKLIVNDNYILNTKTNKYEPFQSVNDSIYDLITSYREIDGVIAFSFKRNITKIIFPNGRVKTFKYNRPRYDFNIYRNELWDIFGRITYYNYDSDVLETIPLNTPAGAFVHEDSIAWFISKDFIFKLDKTNKLVYRYPDEFSKILNIAASDDYLFLNHGDRITRLSKDFVNSNLILNKKFEDEENDFQVYMKVIQYNNEPIKVIEVFREIKRKFANSENKLIRKKIEELQHKKIVNTIKFISDKDYTTVINKLDSNEYVDIEDILLYSLSVHHGMKRRVDSSLKYYKLLKSKYPESNFLKQFKQSDIDNLNAVSEELKSINTEKISNDIKLWKKYEIYKKYPFSRLFAGPWLSRPFQYCFLDSIALLYPQSQYADNAEWINKKFSNVFRNEGVEERIYSSNSLDFYRSFILNYPKSEFLPEVLKDMAYLYTYCGDSIQERILNIDSAQIIYDRLQKEFPDFAAKEKLSKYNDLKSKLLKGSLGWKFSIKLSKQTYNRSEPIEIEFIYENELNIKRDLNLYEEIPNFGVYVLGESEFIEIPTNSNYEKRTVSIEPLGIYSEKWDITKMIRLNYNRKVGYFKIGNTGGLAITAVTGIEGSEPISSKEVRVKIID